MTPTYEEKQAAYNREQKKAEKGGNFRSTFNSSLMEEHGLKFYKAKDNDNFIAFVPPPVYPNNYHGLGVYIHYNVGANRESFLCLSKMKNSPCPICEQRDALMRTGNRDDERMQKTLSDLKPVLRYLFYIVDMENAGTVQEGVKLYNAPKSVTLGLNGISIDPRTGELIEADLLSEITDKNGVVVKPKDLFFKKVVTGKKTDYSAFQLYPRRTDLHKNIADGLPPFEELLQYYPYDEVLSAISSVAPATAPVQRERFESSTGDGGAENLREQVKARREKSDPFGDDE